MGKAQDLGHVVAEYPKADGDAPKDEEDYDEEIQLYAEDRHSQTKPVKLTIQMIDILGDRKMALLAIPYGTDHLLNNLIATHVISKIAYQKLVAISIDNKLSHPGYLTNITTIKPLEPLVPLQPPDYLSDPICAFISKSVMLNKDTIGLASNDTVNDLIDVFRALADYLALKDPHYLDKCHKILGYGAATSGLYV